MLIIRKFFNYIKQSYKIILKLHKKKLRKYCNKNFNFIEQAYKIISELNIKIRT